MTVLLSLAIIAFGFFTYKLLPVNDLPAVDYPVINVSVSYPGASPETMANNIATPLEKQFLLIDGLELITSASTQSNTSLTLQFNLSKSLDGAATDVQAAIQRATGQLPTDLPSPPTFTKTNPERSGHPAFGTGDRHHDRRGFVQVRQQRRGPADFSIIQGVSQVQVYGVQGAMRIKADPGALVNRGLTMTDLASGITAGTAYSGAGQLDGTHRTFVVQPHGQLDSVDGYKSPDRGPEPGPVAGVSQGRGKGVLRLAGRAAVAQVLGAGSEPPARLDGGAGCVAAARLERRGSGARPSRKVLPTLKAGLPGSIKLLQCLRPLAYHRGFGP